jgi:hypothetical protein
VDATRLRDLIESSDLDGLVRFVDGLVTTADWDGLVAVRDGCLEAVKRGKQLWGAAQFAEYRMALDAPAPLAGSVVRSGAGRFSVGPLWEVAASTHTWDELAAHLEDPATRAYAAHERVIRGDHLEGAEIDVQVVDLPLTLAPWEPRYPVAVYRPDGADFPEHELPDLEWLDLAGPALGGWSDEPLDALLELVKPWVNESSGRAEGRAVEGTAHQAIRALGPHRVRAVDVTLADAVAIMAWAGASGGAYGRRRGSPVGRSGAWWALATLVGMEDEWPPDAAALGAEAAGLRFVAWDPGDRVGGWNLHLAVEDPGDGLAWAVTATDWH